MNGTIPDNSRLLTIIFKQRVKNCHLNSDELRLLGKNKIETSEGEEKRGSSSSGLRFRVPPIFGGLLFRVFVFRSGLSDLRSSFSQQTWRTSNKKALTYEKWIRHFWLSNVNEKETTGCTSLTYLRSGLRISYSWLAGDWLHRNSERPVSVTVAP